MVNSIKNLVSTIKSSNKSSASIFIGTPAIDGSSGNFQNASMYSYLVTYINDLKAALGTNWSSITGIYMNAESIWGTVDYANLITNPTIKLFNNLAYDVHVTFGKKFMWVPYYTVKEADAATKVKNIGYVANKTNIFDYILIQPQYYFNGTSGCEAPLSNLDGVYYSVTKQAVTYRDGTLVVAKSSGATAQIGVQMEIDGNTMVNSAFSSRYNAYVSKFSPFVNNYPLSFYMGAKGDAGTPVLGQFYNLISKVNSFYS